MYFWAEETGSSETEDRRPAGWDRVRVLIAEDSRLVAEALMFSLESDPTLEVIGYALDGWDALDYMATLKPDVVVVGPRLTDLCPFEFIRVARELSPNILLITLCERLVPAAVESAYALGVADCLPVTRSVDELLSSIADACSRQQTFERGRRQAARRSTQTRRWYGEVDAHS